MKLKHLQSLTQQIEVSTRGCTLYYAYVNFYFIFFHVLQTIWALRRNNNSSPSISVPFDRSATFSIPSTSKSLSTQIVPSLFGTSSLGLFTLIFQVSTTCPNLHTCPAHLDLLLFNTPIIVTIFRSYWISFDGLSLSRILLQCQGKSCCCSEIKILFGVIINPTQ